MSVLSENRIKERMRLPITNPASFVVTPFLNPDKFDLDSLDLRLGTHFLLPQIPPEPFYYPSRTVASGHLRVHVPIGAYIVVPAHQTVLGVTLEFIKLPFDVCGEILTKSSVARTFIVIETAPWIHPFYRGCLTLEIANVSNTPLLLYPGRLIGQLILMDVDSPTQPTKMSGSYLGPVYPEPPKFKDPWQDLKDIGITRYRDPYRGWRNTTRSQNRVTVETQITETGRSDKVRVMSGQEPFAVAAEEAVRSSTFTAFKVGGRPTSVSAEIDIDFGDTPKKS
jgi:dCTP deaminase